MLIRIVIFVAVLISEIDGVFAQQAITPALIQRGKKATALVLDETGKGIGTAFCVDAKGYFVTNYHVVADHDRKYSLVLNAGEEDAQKLDVEIVRRAPKSDLALLLAAEGRDLTALSLSSKEELFETETVIAFGFPFGKEVIEDKTEYPTISVIVARITALRKSEGILDRIQFDSQLNPGNSGGPVVNSDGEIIGVASATLLGVTDVGVLNSGINIAIPSARIDALLREPTITVHTVKPPLNEQPLEIEFSVDQFEQFRIRDLRVAMVLDVNGNRTETPLEPNESNRYRFSTPNVAGSIVEKEPAGELEFADGSISGVVANMQEMVGDLGCTLGDIASIRKSEKKFIVRLQSGIIHELSELPKHEIQFKLGGKIISVPLDELRALTLYPTKLKGIQARYEIIVRDGDNIVGRANGRLGASAGLEVAADKTDVVPKLYSPESVERGKTLSEVKRFKVTGGVEEILPLPAESRVLVRNSGSQITLLDLETGQVLSTQSARNLFSDMDVSPDGGTVYAADYGGENTGRGMPLKPHFVHRFDVASETWDVAEAPKIALRIEVVDPETFVLQEGDQWINISLNRWRAGGAAVTELSRMRSDYAGDCEYDPFFGRLLHGNSGLSRSSVNAYRVGATEFTHMESGESSSGYTRGGVVLNADGRFFFHDSQQVDARDLKRVLKVFPSSVKGATADLAMTEAEVCDIETAEVLKRWGYKADAIGVSLSGNYVITHDADKDELVVYEVRN